MSAETAVVKPSNPFDLVQMAVEQNVDVDKLERLLDMQKEWQAQEAFRAYAEAMNRCQEEMPVVVKDKKNEQTGSLYARLERVAESIRPVYVKHGFSLDFTEDDSPLEGHRRIICTATHIGGHQKQFRLDSKIDNVGAKGTPNKTDIQGLGSMCSYLRRYLTLMVFNITVADEDNDGNSHEPTMTGDMLLILRTKIEEHVAAGMSEVDAAGYEAKFVKWLGQQQKTPDLTALDDIHASLFARAVKTLDDKYRTHMAAKKGEPTDANH